MKKKKVTNLDIAAAAGVSPTAVSFALNGREGISRETRQLIFETARKLGYRISVHRKMLNIALLFRNDLHDFDQLFYSEMSTRFIDECRTLPYNLVMATVYHEGEEVCFSDILNTGRIDGLLVFGDPDPDILAAIKGLNLPFVILDSIHQEENTPAVYVDYKEAAYKAACCLIDAGHRDIAFIGCNSKGIHDFTLLTFRGFQKATEKSGISLSTNRIQLDITDEETLQRAVDRALEGRKMPTALFCCADYYAIFAIRYLHSLGIRVPEDISVIGIDDIIVSRFMIPSLTTVKIDHDQIVRKGIDLLVRKISGANAESVSISDFEIAMRDSVSAPRHEV